MCYFNCLALFLCFSCPPWSRFPLPDGRSDSIFIGFTKVHRFDNNINILQKFQPYKCSFLMESPSGLKRIHLTLCHLALCVIFHAICHLLIFFKINFFEKFFQECHKSVRFRSGSKMSVCLVRRTVRINRFIGILRY